MPESLFFSSSNILDFFEIWEYFCKDFQLLNKNKISRISWYFGADLRDYIKILKNYIFWD